MSPTPPSSPPGPGGGNEQTVTMAQGAEFRAADAFSPNPLTVSAGTTVTWVNNDVTTHDPRSDTAGVFNTGSIRTGGGRASVTFQNAGTVRYHCGFHPNMVGTVVVQ